MPGTSLSVVYEKTDDNQLIANSFSARKDEKRKLSLPKFLALAWTAEGKTDRLDKIAPLCTWDAAADLLGHAASKGVCARYASAQCHE